MAVFSKHCCFSSNYLRYLQHVSFNVKREKSKILISLRKTGSEFKLYLQLSAFTQYIYRSERHEPISPCDLFSSHLLILLVCVHSVHILFGKAWNHSPYVLFSSQLLIQLTYLWSLSTCVHGRHEFISPCVLFTSLLLIQHTCSLLIYVHWKCINHVFLFLSCLMIQLVCVHSVYMLFWKAWKHVSLCFIF